MNLGFRNRDNSCLFEKCMSSGSSFSSLLSEAPFFLFPPMYAHCFAGNVNVPFAGGSNSFFSKSTVLRFEKSIEKASFSLRGLGAVDASVRSAIGNGVRHCQEHQKEYLHTFADNLTKFPMFRASPILGDTCIEVIHHASPTILCHSHN